MVMVSDQETIDIGKPSIPELHSMCWGLDLPLEIPLGIAKLLDRFRPIIVEAVKGNFCDGPFPPWQTWEPPKQIPFPLKLDPDMKTYIQSLKLPGNSELPLMEAYSLGSFRDDDINHRVNDIFHPGQNTFVVF